MACATPQSVLAPVTASATAIREGWALPMATPQAGKLHHGAVVVAVAHGHHRLHGNSQRGAELLQRCALVDAPAVELHVFQRPAVHHRGRELEASGLFERRGHLVHHRRVEVVQDRLDHVSFLPAKHRIPALAVGHKDVALCRLVQGDPAAPPRLPQELQEGVAV